jgi:hypothetical protein
MNSGNIWRDAGCNDIPLCQRPPLSSLNNRNWKRE